VGDVTTEPTLTGTAPPEAVLLEDLTADLSTKVTEAWQEFGRALASALPQLPAGVSVELILDPTASGTEDAVYSVCLTATGDGEITALAVGNNGLPAAYRLGRAAIGDLVALGWSPPGVVPGSGESFGLRAAAAEAAKLAVVVTRTMKDVYGAPHPAFLTYAATAGNGGVVPLPALGSARAVLDTPDVDDAAAVDDYPEGLDTAEFRTFHESVIDPDASRSGRNGRPSSTTSAAGAQSVAVTAALATLPLVERVQLVVAKLLKTSPDQLQVDADGDIGIRAGSAMVFVRVRDNPPLIDVFSPVLTEIEPSERLYVRLSELTNRMPIGRLYCTNDTVWASVPVMGRDFQASHLMLAVQVMTGLADELDDRLQGEFGGKRFYGDAEKVAARAAAEERTGMYL
jgi:hypothetical protein